MSSTPTHDSFRMAPGSIALALALKYLGLTIYGTHAAIASIPSFVTVGGEGLAVTWGTVVAIMAAVAFAAVARSWATNDTRFERVVTAVLITTFLIYSVVLLVRGILLEDWGGIPLVWLPPVLTIFPIIRYFTLVSRS